MTPRTVQISDAVYAHIAEHGRFGETVDDVLRRLFDLGAADGADRSGRDISSPSHSRRPRQATIPMSARVEEGELIVEFRGGSRHTWNVPTNKTGKAVADLSV